MKEEVLCPVAYSAIAADEKWEQALEQALAQVNHARRDAPPVDVVFVFANGEYADYYPEIVRTVRRETGASILIGSSGEGIIGTGVELEETPAVSLLALSLPKAILRPVRFTQAMVEYNTTPGDWHRQLGVSPNEVNAWLVFVDPFQMNSEGLVEGLASAYPGFPMLGGLASNDIAERRSYVFLNDEVYDEGGIGLAIGGPYTILPLVSQGCEPIGEPWTITKVLDNGMIETISNRPAYKLLAETLQKLDPLMQRRALHNLLVGLAADEYLDHFERGSFLIRQLFGADRRSGVIAIGAAPRVGQTIQFQMRDASTADLDLKEMLAQAKDQLGDKQPIAGILCTCNGRGESLFGIPDHDAGMIAQQLGPLPLTGLFCNGEIGPVGKRPFLHGFTASLALLIQQ